MFSNMVRVCALCFLVSLILPLMVLQPDFIDASTVDEQEDPPLWHLAPGSLKDFPTVEGHTVIDPWDYLQRLGMYRLMLDHSRVAMHSLGPNNTGNILWGLALQHGWQFKTQRLLNYDTKRHWNCPAVSREEQSTCISASSWWASMNYNLNVVPFLAAVKAGMFKYWRKEIYMLPPRSDEYEEGNVGQGKYSVFQDNITPQEKYIDGQKEQEKSILKSDTQIRSPHHNASQDRSTISGNTMNGGLNQQENLKKVILANQYCHTVAECSRLFPKATAAWTDFFTLVLKLTGSRESLSNSDIEDELLTSMWAAHVESIAESLPVFTDRLQYMSVPEQTFGQGWGHLVGFIAATRFSTNYNNTGKNQRTLPNRVLLSTDHPPNIPDMSAATNRALAILIQLYEWDKYMGGSLDRMWMRAMCTKHGRRLGRNLMEDISSSWGLSAMDIIKLTWVLIWEPCP